MITDPVVGLIIPFNKLAHSFFETANYLFFPFLYTEKTFNDEEFLPMPDILRRHRIEITLAKTEMVYGIHGVGFTHTIITHKAVYLIVEFKILAVKILVVDQGQSLKKHSSAAKEGANYRKITYYLIRVLGKKLYFCATNNSKYGHVQKEGL